MVDSIRLGPVNCAWCGDIVEDAPVGKEWEVYCEACAEKALAPCMEDKGVSLRGKGAWLWLGGTLKDLEAAGATQTQ